MALSSLKLPDLHDGGQYEAFYDEHRFKILICGRRWGKSLLAAVALIACAIEGGTGWWVWPSFPMAMTGWSMLMKMLLPAVIAKVVNAERQERKITFPGGGSIQMKSSERPNSLRGEGLDLVVVDEWAYIRYGKKVFQSDLRPALADKMGKAYLITTPNGKDHVYEYYQHANLGKRESFKAWHFPTWTNPFIPKEEIEVARRDIDDSIFRQEYGAEFLDDAAAFFTRMERVMLAKEQKQAQDGHWYRGGLDIGRRTAAGTNDPSVLSIIDGSMTPWENCLTMKIEDMTFRQQRDRVIDICGRFELEWLTVDSTGEGYGLYEQLAQNADFTVEGFKYSNQGKIDMFSSLRGQYEMEELFILPYEWLKVEHEMMKPDVDPTRLTVRLNAREGFHDDGPNSLALANKAMKNTRVVVA